MRGSISFPACLVVLSLLSTGVSFGAPALESELVTVLEVPGRWTNRLLVETETARLYLLHRENVREQGRREATAGISSAAFVAGPVEPLGLFRETENPLGFGDSSDVFRERSGLALAADLEIAPRHGAWASTPGGGFSLGGFAKGGDGGRIAAASRLDFLDAFSAECLLQTSHPEKAAESEDWFPDKPLYPGGPVHNASARLGARFPRTPAGDVRLGLSSGCSFGERVRGGSFVHAFAAQEGEFAETSFLVGCCDPQYVTPTGSYPAGRFVGSGTVSLFPDAFAEPRVRARIERERQRPLPVRTPPLDEDYSCGLRLGTKRIFCFAEAEYDRDRDADGDRSAGDSLAFEATWRDDFYFLHGRLARRKSGSGEETVSLSLEGEFRRPDWEVAARVRAERDGELLVSGKLEAAVKGRGFRIGASAGLVRGLPVSGAGRRAFALHPLEYAAFSLFWSARSVQPQSPTKRTSGSRE